MGVLLSFFGIVLVVRGEGEGVSLSQLLYWTLICHLYQRFLCFAKTIFKKIFATGIYLFCNLEWDPVSIGFFRWLISKFKRSTIGVNTGYSLHGCFSGSYSLYHLGLCFIPYSGISSWKLYVSIPCLEYPYCMALVGRDTNLFIINRRIFSIIGSCYCKYLG